MMISAKRFLLSCLLSASFLIAGTGVGYLVAFLNRPGGGGGGKARGSSLSSPVDLTDKDRFIDNLLSPSSFKAKEFRAVIGGLDGGKTLSISSDDLAVNLLSKEASGSKNRVSGNLTVSYDGFGSHSFGLYLTEEKATVNYKGALYSIDKPSLQKALSVLEEGNFPLPTVGGLSFELPSLDAIASWGKEVLNNVVETPNPDGETIDYAFPLNPFGTVVLTAEKGSFTLAGIQTPQPLYLPVNGKIVSIFLDAKLSQDLEKSVSEDAPSLYENPLGGISGILGTITSLARSKKADVSIDARLASSSGAEDDLKARVSLDASDLEKPIVQIEAKESNKLDGSALITYSDGRTYVDSEGSIKGYIDDSSLLGLWNVFQKEVGGQVIESLDLFGSFVKKGSPLDRILQGDLSPYKDLLKSLTVSPDGSLWRVEISNKGLGLSDDSSFSLSVKLSSDLSSISSLEVKSFPFLGRKLSAVIEIQNHTAEGMVPVDPSSYGNYNGIFPVVSKLSSLAKEKKLTLDYALAMNTPSLKEPLDLSGILSFDASKATSFDASLDEIPMAFTASTTLEGVKHTLEGRRLNEVAYVSYDDVFRQKADRKEALDIYRSVLDGLKPFQNEEEKQGPSLAERIEKAMDVVTALVSASKGLDLKGIARILSIDNARSDGESIAFDVDTAALGLDFGTVSLYLDAAGDSFFVQADGLTFGDTSMSLNVKTREFLDPRSADLGGGPFQPDEYIPVGKFSNFTNGLFDLIHGEKRYGVSLKASLSSATEGAYTSHLIGKAYFDLETSSYKGEVTYDMDEHGYDPSIQFSYNDAALAGTTNEKRLFVSYRHKKTAFAQDGSYAPMENGSSVLYARMKSANLDSAMEAVETMSSTNLLYSYYSDISHALSTIPLLEIAKAKDYLKYLNDFVRSVRVEPSGKALTVAVNPYYLGLTGDKKAKSVYARFGYDESGITSVDVENAPFDGKSVSFTLTRVGYDDVQAGLVDFSKISESSYIDFDSLPLMVRLGLATTESNGSKDGLLNRTFTLAGRLDLPMPWVLGYKLPDIDNDLLASINVQSKGKGEKAEVSAYVKIAPQDGTGFTTEYFIRPEVEDALIVKREGSATKMLLVEKEEIQKHFAYYVMGVGMNFENTQEAGSWLWFAGDQGGYKSYMVMQIENSFTGEQKDKGGLANSGLYPEKIVKSAAYDEGRKTFSMKADLSSIDPQNSMISLGEMTLEVKHGINPQTARDELLNFKAYGNIVKFNSGFFNILGLTHISLDFNVDQVASKDYYSEAFLGNWGTYLMNGGSEGSYFRIKSIRQDNANTAFRHLYFLTVESDVKPVVVRP